MTKNATVPCDNMANDPVLSTGSSTGTSHTETLLRRQEVADILGVTVSGVRRLERTGELRPKKRTSQGVWLFEPNEVHSMAGSRSQYQASLTRKSSEPYTSEEASRVFDALDKGLTLVQCVKECLVMPLIVEALAIVHARMGGGMYVSKPTLDAINALPLEGTFPLQNEADLLAVLQTAAQDTCKACETRARTYCKACAFKLGQKASSL